MWVTLQPAPLRCIVKQSEGLGQCDTDTKPLHNIGEEDVTRIYAEKKGNLFYATSFRFKQKQRSTDAL